MFESVLLLPQPGFSISEMPEPPFLIISLQNVMEEHSSFGLKIPMWRDRQMPPLIVFSKIFNGWGFTGKKALTGMRRRVPIVNLNVYHFIVTMQSGCYK